MSLPEDRFLSPSFDGDALTKERKDNMLNPIEVTMTAVKTFSDPQYDNAAKNLFRYPEILAPILANVVPEYQGMSAEQVMNFIVKSSIRTCSCTGNRTRLSRRESNPL